ncbi:uncharacterized protein E0L32_000806 [Thyridium curvatum]|uniref:BTB domain-containing protein n=1 Tax=Thyridium curvatum TaxID=1093900 RepID=A0A507B5J6_9PEZI|nr:uncharacterized protein E0L32_000806 [Thyridium curvatum]TPX12629.1 hypothetical protein E0L32_000806 [Thyridium curvatum]
MPGSATTQAAQTTQTLFDIQKAQFSASSEKDQEHITRNLSDRATCDLTLLQSGNYADVLVSCGDFTWRVHKSIICTRSPWFWLALKGVYKEASDGEVRIENDIFDAKSVRMLLLYLYTDDVNTTIEMAAHLGYCESSWDGHIICWALGDFFRLPYLQEKALEALERDCRIARTSMCVLPKPQCDTAHIFSAIRLAYGVFSNAKRCQRLLLDLVYDARVTLFDDPGFQELYREIPELAVGLLDGVTNSGNSAGEFCDRAGWSLPDDFTECDFCNIVEEVDDMPAVYFTVDDPDTTTKTKELGGGYWKFVCQRHYVSGLGTKLVGFFYETWADLSEDHILTLHTLPPDFYIDLYKGALYPTRSVVENLKW